jgi:deoxyribodipyrimidine photo-lyase
MIQPERILKLNDRPTRPGRYVLYWMQASHRAEYNHALEYAVREANEQKLPVVAFFGLTENFPEANLRHYTFLVEGLQDAHMALDRRGIRLVVRHGSPEDAVLELAEDASLVVTDRGYLRIQKNWREKAASKVPCAMIQVETDAVVPVETASEKEAYSAAVHRPRIHRELGRFLVPLMETKVTRDSLDIKLASLNMKKPPDDLLRSLSVDRSVLPAKAFQGGTSRAKRLLDDFIARKLPHYAEHRADPSSDYSSGLSPYLHFGQISPLCIALKVRAAKTAPQEAKGAFLEELIVRRELSLNFVHYNASYDSFSSLPEWPIKTLKKHSRDRRPWLYSRKELENARTHDLFWNAAQREMVVTGRMHNTMRMYWGKKILEWSATPEEAFQTALYLNNKYELDGRDPNSFAGIAWCFGKHDRPWKERDIFGTVRYMNAEGLRRKFKIDVYVKKINELRK